MSSPPPERVVIDCETNEEQTVPLTPAEEAEYAEREEAAAAASIRYVGQLELTEERIQTTDDTPTEIYRFLSQLNHAYTATVTFLGASEALAAIKETTMRYVWRRASSGAVFVGEFVFTDIPEQASADWNVAARCEGNDFVLEVIGERTGTVDWLLRGTIEAFAPEGVNPEELP